MPATRKGSAFFSAAHIVCILVFSIFALSGVAAQDHTITYEDKIVYATVDGIDLELSIAYPNDGEGPFPGLVMICGNGWGMSGNRRDIYSNRIRLAAMNGYVAITIDYRYTSYRSAGRPLYPFPAQVHDVKRAVRWFRANAEKYRLNPDRIGALGFSSGGHLSLMLGLTDPADGLEGPGDDLSISSKVQAVVSSSAPTELVSLCKEAELASSLIVANLIGGSPEQYPAEYAAASPVNYVSPGDAPVLIMQGRKDTSVVFRQAEILDARMNEVGVEHTFVIRENGKHADFTDSLIAWEFLDEKLKGP